MTLPEPAPLLLDPGARRNDQLLVVRVLDGDRTAARELYDAHVARVFRLAYRFSGDKAQAEDLVQDSFIRVFAQLQGFRGEAALSSWVYRVALSVMANSRRRDGWRDRETDFDSVAPIADERAADGDPDLGDRLQAEINALHFADGLIDEEVSHL